MAKRAILRVEGLVARAPDGTLILDEVGFSIPRGSVVAVVGPTGAGKTTLLNALTGSVSLERGRILLDGVNLLKSDDQTRRRIGYVPQDDALHGQLDLQRTLEYSAILRLPPTVSEADRARRVAAVLAELGLASHAHVPVSSLSGGQRKRANVAVELIAEPEVLILDEPTSGLDPGYEKSVLRTLREVADRGRTVLTVTHSLQALALCDLVLFLAPGGRVAFYGPPAEALAYFGDGDAADVFIDLDTGPGEVWKDKFRNHPAYAQYVESPVTPAGVVEAGPPERGSASQLRVLVCRYIDHIKADRRQLAMLCLQGPVLGLLLWAVLTPGALGRRPPAADAVTVAVFVAISATWLGAANAVREIVKEHRIARRERGSGLSIAAYIGSKAIVLGTMTMIQAALLAAIAISSQDAPGRGAVLSNGAAEMMVGAALTALAAVALGLLISSLVNTPDKAVSLLPMALVAQLVLSGGWAKVLSTPGLHQVADVTAARWGVQALEATTRGDAHAWWTAVAALTALTAGCLLISGVLVRARLDPIGNIHRNGDGRVVVPAAVLCAAVTAIALMAAGGKTLPPSRFAAAHATAVHATVSKPAAKPVATPPAPPTPARPSLEASPARAAAPAVAVAPAVVTTPTTVPAAPTPTTPPVTTPPTTTPPATTPPTTVAPAPATTQASTPANNWAAFVAAYQWWASTMRGQP